MSTVQAASSFCTAIRSESRTGTAFDAVMTPPYRYGARHNTLFSETKPCRTWQCNNTPPRLIVPHSFATTDGTRHKTVQALNLDMERATFDLLDALMLTSALPACKVVEHRPLVGRAQPILLRWVPPVCGPTDPAASSERTPGSTHRYRENPPFRTR